MTRPGFRGGFLNSGKAFLRLRDVSILQVRGCPAGCATNGEGVAVAVNVCGIVSDRPMVAVAGVDPLSLWTELAKAALGKAEHGLPVVVRADELRTCSRK